MSAPEKRKNVESVSWQSLTTNFCCVCAVCIKFLTKFYNGLPSDDQSNPAAIEKKLKKACGAAKKRENRFVSPCVVVVWIFK